MDILYSLQSFYTNTNSGDSFPICFKKMCEVLDKYINSDYSCSYLIFEDDCRELISQKGFSAEQIQNIDFRFILDNMNNPYTSDSFPIDKNPLLKDFDTKVDVFLFSIDISLIMPSNNGHYVMLFMVNSLKREISNDDKYLILKTYPQVWYSILTSKLVSFRQSLINVNYELNELENIIKEIRFVQSWLKNSEICTFFEKIISIVNNNIKEKNNDFKGIIIQLNLFKNNLHCCLEKCWQCNNECDSDDKENRIFEWYLWRLSNQEDSFEKAVKFTSKSIAKSFSKLENKPFNNILNKYFLHKICNNHKLIKNSIEGNGMETKISNRNHFGRFMAESLAESPYTMDSIESIIWILSEYAYSVLNIDKRLHVASHLRHAARGESSLHMMKDFYRDHFFHTIEVCLLGMIILDAEPNNFPEKKFIMDQDDASQKWFLTSLLHDIGYAIDVCDGLNDWLEFFTSEAFSSIREQLKNILSGKNSDKTGIVGNLKTEFQQFYEENGFVESLDKPYKDHGLIGAYHLKTLIGSINKHSKIDTYKEPIGAISKHNCQRIKIDYKLEPLAALLVLCDTLQSWWRPQFPHFSLGPAWMMSVLNHQTRIVDPPFITSAKLITNIQFVNEGDTFIPRFNNTMILRLEFDEAVNRDSFVFNIWLDTLCNLQRVDFTCLSYNIIVQLKTPIYISKDAQRKYKRIKQMDRLRDAACETHMAYLDAFIKLTREEKPSIPEISNNIDPKVFYPDIPITYYTAKGSTKDEVEWEMLSISLKQLDGSRQYVKNGISRFRKDLKGWKYYYEDRLMAGDYSPWRHEVF